MTNKVYIGNLPYDASEADLEAFFADAGEVTDTRIITDRMTGRSRGFAFVTFSNAEGAKNALAKNDQPMNGRNLRISEARDKEEQGGGGGRGDRGGRGGHGGHRGERGGRDHG